MLTCIFFSHTNLHEQMEWNWFEEGKKSTTQRKRHFNKIHTTQCTYSEVHKSQFIRRLVSFPSLFYFCFGFFFSYSTWNEHTQTHTRWKCSIILRWNVMISLPNGKEWLYLFINTHTRACPRTDIFNQENGSLPLVGKDGEKWTKRKSNNHTQSCTFRKFLFCDM